jgi:hypothetical protein
VSEIRVYFEGNAALRPGFRKFFENIYDWAKTKGCRVDLIACGSDWPREFRNAIKRHPLAWNLLLIDSERPLAAYRSAEECARNGWDKSYADSIFWMVEAMESWFHADKDAVESYYRDGFNRKALVANPLVEKIPKKDLLDGLKEATRHTQKGKYHKTAHAPKMLAAIDRDKVRKAAPNCDRLFDALETKLNNYGNS